MGRVSQGWAWRGRIGTGWGGGIESDALVPYLWYVVGRARSSVILLTILMTRQFPETDTNIVCSTDAMRICMIGFSAPEFVFSDSFKKCNFLIASPRLRPKSRDQNFATESGHY